MKKGFEIGLVYAGTVIGAGFASGRELWQFFGRFGSRGAIGLLAAFILYFVLGYLMFSIIGKSGEKEACDLFGKKGRPLMVLNLGFMFILFVSMTAAAGALCKQVLGLKGAVGSFLFCLGIYACTFKGKDSIVKANVILTPVLVLLGIISAAAVCPFWKTVLPEYSSAGALAALSSGFIYVSYNILSLGAVMLPLREDLKSKGVIRLWASLFGSLLMLVLGLCLFSLIVKYSETSERAALPVLVIIKEVNGGIFYGIYGLVLLSAVLTTAIGNFFGFTESLFKEKSGSILRILVLLLGFVCSLIGFSGIISVIYPFFGILGLLNIMFIVWHSLQ